MVPIVLGAFAFGGFANPKASQKNFWPFSDFFVVVG